MEQRVYYFRTAYYKDKECTDFSHFGYWGSEIGLHFKTTTTDAPFGVSDQWTGLCDKNGNKIFLDSDVVLVKFKLEVETFGECHWIVTDEQGNKTYEKMEGLRAVAVIENPKTGIVFYNKEHNVRRPLWGILQKDLDEVEIIGNIHENPELLLVNNEKTK
jgi:uncharacterized phage protein (TIGR01671 family)